MESATHNRLTVISEKNASTRFIKLTEIDVKCNMIR